MKLNPKQPHVFMTAKAIQPEMKKVEVKPVEVDPRFEEAKIEVDSKQPKRPRDEVKVGNLSTGSAAPATGARKSSLHPARPAPARRLQSNCPDSIPPHPKAP